MAKEHPPSFQFYPRDFLSDTAVEAMTCEELGGYQRLLCHAWLQEEPGVLPADDELLAKLSRLAERWSACRTAIQRAFAVTDTTWVQKRMVAERQAQQRRYERAARGASVTNAARRNRVAERDLSERSAVAPSSSSSVESTSTPLLDQKPSSVEVGVPQPSLLTLEALRNGSHPLSKRAAPRSLEAQEPAGFAEWYESYPKHVARPDAARAYRQVVKSQWAAETLMRTTPLWERRWFAEDRDQSKVPYPATFLRKGMWQEAPEED